MTRPDLDDLHATLRSACSQTRQRLDDYELGTLSRVFDVDADGKPAFVVWQCRLPSGDGGERNYEMLRLPWDSFIESETVLAELSVSFDCEISKQVTGEHGQPASYTLKPKKSGRAGPRYRFETRLRADHDYVAEPSINDIPLEQFLAQPAVDAELERLPLIEDLWLGLKGIRAALLELLAVLLVLAAPILAWLYFSGQI